MDTGINEVNCDENRNGKFGKVGAFKWNVSENIHTGEVYSGCIYLAKSLDVNDFEEITVEEYEKIIGERSSEE